MAEVARQVSNSSDALCAICHEEENIYSIAPCNHHICFRCSTRLRLLHHQYYCPICRADCDLVLFVHKVADYASYPQKQFIKSYKVKAHFEDKNVKAAVDALTVHRCSFCKDEQNESFRSFKTLQTHVRKTHQLFYCEICVEFVKLFSSERKAYTRQDLALHKRKGDPNDSSFKGHPLCQLCDKRFLDTDELWRHLRKDHYYCHFCDADGSHIYFGSYNDVKDHFRESHFLCEEGECANVEFTNAFRSNIDLIAHKAHSHVKSGKRNQQKQSRLLPVDIHYAKDNQRRPNRERLAREEGGEPSTSEVSKSDKQAVVVKQPHAQANPAKSSQEEQDIARALAASLQAAAPLQSSVDVESTLDFPSLSNDVSTKTSSSSPLPKKKTTAASRAAGLVMVDDNEEFPGLSSSASSAPVRETQPPVVKKVAKPVAAAAVKAKSNPWNQTEDEFPTLEGAKSRSPVHGWHFSKPQSKPSTSTFTGHKRPAINSTSDFPSLGGSASLASIGSWIKTGPKSSKTPAPAPEIPSSISSDPQVNYYADVSSTTSTKVAPNDKKSNKKSVSDQKKSLSDQDGKLSKTVDQPSSSDGKSKSAKKKRQKVKADNGDTKGEDVKEGDKTTTEQSSSSDHSVQEKDGDRATKVQKSSDERTKSAVVEVKKTKVDSSNESSSTTEPTKSNNGLAKSSKSAGKSSKSKKMAALAAELNDDEFPSLPVKTSKKKVKDKAAITKDDFPSLSAKREKEKSSTKSKVDEISFDVSKLSLEDFPPPSADLSPPSSHMGGVTKPPPGFSAPAVKAPPGLGRGSSLTNGNSKPPPGLTNHNAPMNISSVADLITLPVAHTYIEPANFTLRNKKLTFKLKELIYDDMNKFHKFKNHSIDFRGDEITAKDFYDRCFKLLGKETFLEILPELLVLLPDLTKQQSLHSICAEEVAQYHKSQSWTVIDNSLTQCNVCKQILMPFDVAHHESQHSDTADFPSLSHALAPPAVRKAW